MITTIGVLIILIVGVLIGYGFGWMNASIKKVEKKNISSVSKYENANFQNDHEQAFINKVIELLKTNPEKFSARWFTGESLDSSVQSNNKHILIMFDGQITQPILPAMTTEQKLMVKELIAPIIKKDSEFLIDKLLKENEK